MSFSGQSPNAKRIRYTPQSTDPVNPSEGDFFYSDGTPRAAGPWVYQGGAWQQVSTSGSLTTVNSITFSPQSSDPGTPVEGLVFYADGTSRSEGLWLYINSGWIPISRLRYQEFYYKSVVRVRAASTVNITLASQAESGDSFGGVTLATNDIILVKNQTAASENGVYVVQTTGAPVRHSSANTAGLLSRYTAYVNSGTNAGTMWFQNADLSTLSDAQSWSSTIGTFSFEVPAGVTQLLVTACGGGGAGGAGGGNDGSGASSGGGGGAGGNGVQPTTRVVTVVPGDTLTVTAGACGLGKIGTTLAGTAGGSGGNSLITGTGLTLTFQGADGGSGGERGSGGGVHLGGVNAQPSFDVTREQTRGGSGGNGGVVTSGSNGAASLFITAGGSGASGLGPSFGGGGGGGASGLGQGANSGSSGTSGSKPATAGDASGFGAGGGGSGGVGNTSGAVAAGDSGCGGPGFIRVIW